MSNNQNSLPSQNLQSDSLENQPLQVSNQFTTQPGQTRSAPQHPPATPPEQRTYSINCSEAKDGAVIEVEASSEPPS